MASVSPQAELLSGAVKNLPPNAFLGPPEEGRTLLLSVAEEFRHLMLDRRYASAVFLLQNKFYPLANNLVLQADKPSVFDTDRSELFQNLDDASQRVASFIPEEKKPNNGLIEVWFDKPGYSSSEKAVLKVVAKNEPVNSDFEYYVSAFVNGASIDVKSRKENLWTATTPSLTTGSTSVTVRSFIQNKRLARNFLVAIRKYQERNFEIDRLLENEADPDRREALDQEKDANNALIADLKLKMTSIRKQVGSDINLNLVVI